MSRWNKRLDPAHSIRKTRAGVINNSVAVMSHELFKRGIIELLELSTMAKDNLSSGN